MRFKTHLIFVMIAIIMASSIVFAIAETDTATVGSQAEQINASKENESAAGQIEPPELDRGQILEAINQTEALLVQEPDNMETRFQLANLLYQAGNFSVAKETLLPVLNDSEPSLEAMLLMAELEYLMGNYDKAEEINQQVMETAPDNVQAQIQAQLNLMFVYYQSNQYAKSLDLFDEMEGQIKLPLLDLMKSFGEESPCQIEWNGTNETVVPFLMTDPLPLLPVEIQGEQIYALIDTGGDTFILDSEIADSMGIQPISSFMGSFAGGTQAEVALAKADSIKIGNVTLMSVPIVLRPTQGRSEEPIDGQYTISGILGTKILQQFLPTIDYVNGRLILREKSEEGKLAFQNEIEGKRVTEVPFCLASTHFMMAKGTLNDKDDLTFFVDSGLASEAAFTAPIQTLEYVGIPVPETTDSGVSGSGEQVTVGLFPIDTLGLGTLRHHNVTGLYGALPPGSYWRHGFITDGIISHQFLRQYAWTIDFSEMEMIFVSEEE